MKARHFNNNNNEDDDDDDDEWGRSDPSLDDRQQQHQYHAAVNDNDHTSKRVKRVNENDTAAVAVSTSYPEVISIMQNTLCKHLLTLRTTSDLVILSLTLRIIFNLFFSSKDHLKFQLEVFLTSVHLRILESGSNKQKQQQQEDLSSSSYNSISIIDAEQLQRG